MTTKRKSNVLLIAIITIVIRICWIFGMTLFENPATPEHKNQLWFGVIFLAVLLYFWSKVSKKETEEMP
jgi:NhaP-type Na+/H+ or K+/H+ antiporter